MDVFMCLCLMDASILQDAANGLNGYKVGEKTLVVKMAGSRGPPSGPG